MSKQQQGFSLIELLLVVTIITIISVISIPFLQKAVGASRNRSAMTTLKAISTIQISYFAKRNRFARLDEVNTESNNTLGTINGTNLERGYFTLTMSPINPTDSDLSGDYQVIATKSADGSNTPCVMALDSSGVISELFGTNCVEE